MQAASFFFLLFFFNAVTTAIWNAPNPSVIHLCVRFKSLYMKHYNSTLPNLIMLYVAHSIPHCCCFGVQGNTVSLFIKAVSAVFLVTSLLLLCGEVKVKFFVIYLIQRNMWVPHTSNKQTNKIKSIYIKDSQSKSAL